jgi:hypothetical protein
VAYHLEENLQDKQAITSSPITNFFHIICPLLDGEAKAGNQKQRIDNTGIKYGIYAGHQLPSISSPIVSVRNELQLKLLVVKDELLVFFYH